MEDAFKGRTDTGIVEMLREEEEIEEGVEKWMEGGKYGKLVELWVKGVDVEWRKLYGENVGKGMRLGRYGLGKEGYWMCDDIEKRRSIDGNEGGWRVGGGV
ncbi:hypothetical protein, partial [Bacillus subtilis]|uniref:hypothetical protein n=1 Tax=Bacillus subtilis TaxID=1423 RepID=UPI0011AAC4DF